MQKLPNADFQHEPCLKNILPEVILATPFPKTMRWAELDIHFARPIHSIVALLGDKIIPFTLGDIKSGRYTCGHYFMNPGKIKIPSPKDYIKTLRDANVMVDLQARKKCVEKEIIRLPKVSAERFCLMTNWWTL